MKKRESSFSIQLLHVTSDYHVFIESSLIGWGVLVYAVFPCWLSSLLVLVTFFYSFPQPTVFIRRWRESKLHVWQFTILFKIMLNNLVPFWLASSCYFLRAIYYNSKISFLSGSSYFTVHYGLPGVLFFSPHALFCFTDAEFHLPLYWWFFFFWYKTSPARALSQLLFLTLRLLTSSPIPFLDHLWIE